MKRKVEIGTALLEASWMVVVGTNQRTSWMEVVDTATGHHRDEAVRMQN